MLTRESLAALVAERDRCSDGRSAGCATCGLRHSCRLDEGANAAGKPSGHTPLCTRCRT